MSYLLASHTSLEKLRGTAEQRTGVKTVTVQTGHNTWALIAGDEAIQGLRIRYAQGRYHLKCDKLPEKPKELCKEAKARRSLRKLVLDLMFKGMPGYGR